MSIMERRRALMEAGCNAPKWQTIDVQRRKSFRAIVNSAGIVPPRNGVIYLRRDSNRVYTSGNVLLGYVITVFNGVIFGANSYRIIIGVTEDNPIVPNEHSFFDGTNNNGGDWTIKEGVLYRSGDDSTVETDEKIKVLVIEVPSADSFLPEVST